MKIRAVPLVLALCAVPTLTAGSASAQAPTQSDALTEMARKRFEEGVRHFDQGDYPRAQAAFLQAWALKKHPAVLLNLAQSELRAGNHVDAARHFAQYLHEYPDTPQDQQALAQEGLRDARKHTGLLEVAVSTEGAEVLVDGEVVGRSPLPGPVDVQPGSHQVEVRLPGAPPASQQTSVQAGQSVPLHFVVETPASAEEAVPPAGGDPTGREPEPDAEPGGRKSFVSWAGSDPVAWGTLGATGLGLGLGVTFAFMTAAAADDADSVSAQITAVASRDDGLQNYEGLDRRDNPCADPVPKTVQTDYAPACAQLRDHLDTRDSRRTKMWIGFGLAAVGAAGTGVAYYLRTQPQDEAAAHRETKGFTAVTPLWSPEVTGVGVVGSF